MKIYNIINNKGGVGKSELAINLSVEAGRKGLRVLLVSLDPQSNSTNRILRTPSKHSLISLSELRNLHDKYSREEQVMDGFKALHEFVRKPNFKLEVTDVLLDPKKIHEAIIKSEYQNLWVLPSSNSLADVDVELKTAKYAGSLGTRLRRALNLVKNDFDLVVLDNAPFESTLTLNGIYACENEGDMILIPVKIDEGGLEGLDKTLSTLYGILEDEELLYDYKIVITMKDRGKIDDETIRTLRHLFGDRVYSNTVRYQPNPIKDCSLRSDVLTLKSRKNVARDYMSLCDEIISDVIKS